MTEKLFQYIWQLQYFNRPGLQTTGGEAVEVIHPGTLNTNQGPDFLNARIRIGPTILAGSVELHIRSSQWWKHGHGPDPNYRNVILHVVMEHDQEMPPNIPTLELKGRVSGLLLRRYEQLMNATGFIACAGSLHQVSDLAWTAWRERLAAGRLTRKSEKIFESLRRNNFHWEETFWQVLARSFGARLNADLFEAVALSLPLSLMGRHKNQIHQLEALLLGQANLLAARFTEDYPTMLKKEYEFYRRKYKLQPVHIRPVFHRMRPAGFPTLRLAQLAMLLHRSAHLFSLLIESASVEAICDKMEITANDYWHYHYRFDEPTAYREKKIGAEMTGGMIVNTFAPMLFAYGLYHQDEKYKERALSWLTQVPPEQNQITRGFGRLFVTSASAYDSQSLIELKTQFCDHKRCLQCSIGYRVLGEGAGEKVKGGR